MLDHPPVRACGRSASPPWPDALLELQKTLLMPANQPRGWLGMLVDREATSPRENKRLAAVCARPGCASLPVGEESDSAPTEGLDRALFIKLASAEWIGSHQSFLCLTGRPERKVVVIALSVNKACVMGFRAYTARLAPVHRTPRPRRAAKAGLCRG